MAKPQLSEFEKELRARLGARQLQDVREVCKIPAGRRFVHYLLRFCRVYDTNIYRDRASEWREGRRQAGLYLMALVHKADPALRLRIEQEYYSEALSNEVKREKAKKEPA